MRHARAPGTGDPADFRLEDCATQRNLSDEGRIQARRIGEAFRQRRIAVAGVLSSRWCRSLDTARLAFGDAVRPFPPLDSFFAGRGSSEAQTQDVRREIASWHGREGVLVMVSHQVNITALTGIFPQEGEVLVLVPDSNGEPRVVGSVRP
jgi:phosphohistidine phosphatase SixA